jgi:hypothetical protein
MRRFLLAASLLGGCSGSNASSTDADASPAGASPGLDAQAVEVGHEVRPESLLGLFPPNATFAARVNTSSAPLKFTVANINDQATGAPMVSLGGAHAADFVIASSDCGAPVAAGGTCSIDVVFRPQTVGNKTAILLVATNPGGMAVASLDGQAVTDGFDLMPGAVDFGMVMVGTTGTPAVWVIPNPGGVAASIATVMVSGADFVLVADTCSGTTVAPGEKCMFQVAFRPATTGLKSGSVLVDAGTSGKSSASLTGTGL